MDHPYVTLNNSVKMPQIGLGSWQAHGEEVERAVGAAIKAGYRLIDTAAIYGNEDGIGRAIAHSDCAREEFFITTKLWNADQGYHKTLAAFEASRNRLGLDYLDLYLIHWPSPALDLYQESWRALEKLYTEGKVRAIGVSNFTPVHLAKLLTTATIVPAVNQIELHPQFTQHETREFCRQHGIAVESYSPLGTHKGPLLINSTLKEIALTHHKSTAQVMIRWHIQQGLIVIPKSVHPERIIANIDVFDFELSGEDMQRITALDTGQKIGADPDTANFHVRTNLGQLAHRLGLVR